MTHTEWLLLALLLIFALPWLVWRLLRTDGWAPLVVVQILAGIALGPGLFGTWAPALHAQLFSPAVLTGLGALAMWGVIVFVWLAGLELKLDEAWAERLDTGVTAGLALAVPLAAGALAALALLWHSSDWIGANGTRWQFVLGIGMACAVTALPILVLFMDRLRILRRPLGQRVLRYASLDDIAIWAVMSLILLDFQRLGRQGAFFALFALVALGLRALMRRIDEPDRWPLALVWLLACALASDWAGLHYLVGAFLAGVVLDARWFDQQRTDLLRDYVLLLLMPVFFLMTGLRTEWGVGGAAVFVAAALLLIAAVAGKLAGVALAGRLLGWPAGEARVVGWLLQTKALIMIIFSSILLDRGVISADAFTALLLMAVASTMLTIPMLARRPLPTQASLPAREPS